MKSSHSHCTRLYCTAEGFNAQQTALMHSKYCMAEGFNAQQTVLMHNKQLYYIIEGLNAQQKALLHHRKLYCIADGFIAQQEVLSHSRKVSLTAKTREKFLLWQKTEDKPTLQCLPLDLDLMFAHKLAAAKWYFGAHSVERQARIPS